MSCFRGNVLPHRYLNPVLFFAVDSDLLHPRQRSLIASLQLRFRLAEQKQDVAAKQALFREAIHLGIQPHLFTGSR